MTEIDFLRDNVNGDDIKTFCDKIELSREAYEAAEPLCRRIIGEKRDYFENEIVADIKDANKIHALAKSMVVDRDLCMLSCAILLGMNAHKLYKEKGIPEDIYYPSMREITIWERTCEREKQKIGYYEYSWLRHFLTADIVRLHRLEFHIVSFNRKLRYKKHGVSVKGGDEVINIHIPEDGPLYYSDVIESYRRAYRYFNRSGKAVFVCDSWLLYPGNYDFLPPTSRIREFMDDFDIISRNDVKNDGNLWRIFGRRDSYDPENLPRNTDLQRRMADYLAANDNVTGSGYGVFVFDGEKVVKE